ncbi:hypothetical protein [Luteimonas vadosa]|uniref:Uncharacterized protein n=1 Tax=Luteimonas vadosa TaxID=1165507 RepID=A0ABP9E311_9GAMM
MIPDKRERPDTTPGVDPGDQPGYAEEQPDSREDAQRRGAGTDTDPDEGGLDREPDASADPAED